MKLTIRPITIHDGPLFIEFMDSLSFSHQPLWKGCYCRYYHTDCSQPDWNKRSEEMNKQEALNAIDAGLMHGYLDREREGTRVIGVINAAVEELYSASGSDTLSAVGIMATEGTIASGGYERTINEIFSAGL